jgi:phosphoglycerate dehydrogenase-like enzyme
MTEESIKVMVTAPIGDELLCQIAEVSPRLKVIDAAELATLEKEGDLSRRSEFDALLAGAEVLYGGLRIPPDFMSRAPLLKWLQLMSAGANRVLTDETRRSPLVITNVSGIHANPIAETVMGFMLMFVKKAPLCFELKQKREWQHFRTALLRGKTVGVVGLGHIGREVARLASAFGMRVVATRRSVTIGSRARYVDLLLPRGQLPQLLADSDFVVISAPLTPETDGLIGEAELRMMKSTAYLINVARGRIVDESVLARALAENWIAGAGLDVFVTEPLPADSPLWDLQNAILSPHISGVMENYSERATEIFLENLRRYVAGAKLINVVDKEKGY